MIVRTDRGEFQVRWRHNREVEFAVPKEVMDRLRDTTPLRFSGESHLTAKVELRVLSRGGHCNCTIVRLTSREEDFRVIACADARCSDDDNYCKDTGRRESMTNALGQCSGFNSNTRFDFWKAYRALKQKKD